MTVPLCTCKAPPGKTGTGRNRRRREHQSECELVVYIEKLERLRDGAGELQGALAKLAIDAESYHHDAESALNMLKELRG